MPTYLQLAVVHLVTVLPSFCLGTFLMLRRKGTPLHRALGKVYMVLMAFTCIVTLFMRARIGPQLLGHFGMIHLLSLLTLVSVPRAWIAARRHDIVSHRKAMVAVYVGGLLIAGSFAFAPGRLLHVWLFGGTAA